jgi:UDP-N-acetylmuramoyl-L-alanyl-D-glutamate--2,6-diaminopimelate ligase
VGVVNIDDPYSDMFLQATVDTLITFGNSANAQIRALNIESNSLGTTFQIKMPAHTYEIRTQLLGKFNVSNIIAAVGVLHSQKIDIKDIQNSIEAIAEVDGRMQIVPTPLPGKVFVDYAHTEESLKQVLSTLKDLNTGGRIITIF